MRTISVIEFYRWLGVNPYIYMSAFVAVFFVFLLIVAMSQSFFSKKVYERMETEETGDEDRVMVVISHIGSLKTRKVSVTFTDKDDEKYIFNLTNTEATFLALGEQGELKFKGTKYVSFGPPDEKAE